MNKEEIEKLFKNFDIILENYEFDKKCGQLSIDSIYHLFPTEILLLKQYIQDLEHQLEKTSEAIGKLYSKEYIEKQQLISFLENKITENKELIGKIKSYSATGYGIDIATCKIKMIKEVLDFVNKGDEDE